jgi:hypothetical protein
LGPWNRVGASCIWFAVWPFVWFVPPIAYWLDRLGLEHMATVGYHVYAVRNSAPH